MIGWIIAVDWNGLQNHFRQQYSKIENTRKQLFYAWRSFHYDKNNEMFDTYASRIRQIVALLGYGEPQILEVFKMHFLTDYIGYFFPIDDLKLVVEMAKNDPNKGED